MTVVFLVAAMLLGLLSCVSVRESGSPATASPVATTPLTSASLPMSSPSAITGGAPPVGWPLPNADYSNTRAAAGSTIDSSNVKSLGVAWAYPLAGVARGNPIIAGGVIYYQDFDRNVVAIDRYGNVRWEKQYNMPGSGPEGVAVDGDKVFVDAGGDTLAALDIASGEESWSTQLTGSRIAMINFQPVVYKGLVYVSTTTSGLTQPAAGGAVGTIYALDENTGKIKWSFSTADSPDVWGNPALNGGGGSYFPPAIDTATGITYWGTAGPAPFPGTAQFPNGSSRPGDNLYTDSLLALDAGQGTLAWFKQVLAHDLFGYSLAASPVLVTATVDGLKRDIVVAAGKAGEVYAFDRRTGAVLWQTAVGKHENDGLKKLPSGSTRVYPGGQGGVESPLAVAGGVVYAAVNDQYADFTPSSTTPQSILDAASRLVAISIDTGKVLWDRPFSSLSAGPPTVINDLVFIGTLDGVIHALDRNTGEEVWRYQASPDTATGWLAASGDMLVTALDRDGVPSLVGFSPGSQKPLIAVASPVNDSWIPPESNLTINVAVFNFKLAGGSNIGGPARPGEGHLIFYKNVDPPTAPGEPAVTSPGTYAVTASTFYTWQALTMNDEGGYGFWVQLVNNDNTPLDPPVLAAVDVNMMGFHPH